MLLNKGRGFKTTAQGKSIPCAGQSWCRIQARLPSLHFSCSAQKTAILEDSPTKCNIEAFQFQFKSPQHPSPETLGQQQVPANLCWLCTCDTNISQIFPSFVVLWWTTVATWLWAGHGDRSAILPTIATTTKERWLPASPAQLPQARRSWRSLVSPSSFGVLRKKPTALSTDFFRCCFQRMETRITKMYLSKSGRTFFYFKI